MSTIRTQSFLYHLTDMNNLPSIFANGLRSRNQLQSFSDVADPQIIASRQQFRLESYVPFHFFARNPFDGAVQLNNKSKKFALIAVQRSVARQNNWSIIPQHPLSSQTIRIFDYQTGMEVIEWDVMDQRNYHDDRCRRVCMAECLSPTIVLASSFYAIYVKSELDKAMLEQLKAQYGLSCYINVNPQMFVN